MPMRRFPSLRLPLFSRVGVLQTAFGANRRYAAEASARWSRAFAADAELAADLIRLGGVIAPLAQQIEDGAPVLAPVDPARLAYEAGRRDLAVQLVAMMGIGPYELSRMMETNDDA